MFHFLKIMLLAPIGFVIMAIIGFSGVVFIGWPTFTMIILDNFYPNLRLGYEYSGIWFVILLIWFSFLAALLTVSEK